MRARLALVLVFGLLLAACAPDDILDAVEAFGGNTDLRNDADAAVRGAGESADEIQSVRRAEDSLDLVFGPWDEPVALDAPERIEMMERARDLRQSDPRYDFYEAVLYDMRAGTAGNSGDRARFGQASSDALFRAADKVKTTWPWLSKDEIHRISVEGYLDAMKDAIDRLEFSSERGELTLLYCAWIEVEYTRELGDTFPVETALYLSQSADFSSCDD